MLRFAANLGFLFTEHAFLDRFGAAAQAGFRAVEFASPYEHAPRELAARLARHGLENVLFNLPMGDKARGDFGIACRPGREAEFREGVARALDYAEALGTPRLNCIAGLAQPGEDRAGLERILVGNLRFAAAEAARAGRALVIEPINDVDVPGFLVPRCADAVRIVEAVGSPHLGLQLDLYHAAMMGDDGAALAGELSALVRHVQFADAPGRGEPGTGRLDFARLFGAVERSGYAGWVGAEYRPTKPTGQTLHWLSAAS